MKLLIEIDESKVVEYGSVFISYVSPDMFSEEKKSGTMVFASGFKAVNDGTPWFSIGIVQPPQTSESVPVSTETPPNEFAKPEPIQPR